MYTYSWYHWLTFFYIYCFFGWIFESSYVSVKKRRLVNRGFLRLPMLPLYGTGAVMMLWVSLPVQDNLFLVYIAGFLAATALEYFTGWAMEQLFKMRYWDYSDQPFNLNGYVCLGSSIAWGFLTILMTEVLHKPVERFVLGLAPAVEFTFLSVVSVLFASDAVQSVRAALDLGRALEVMTKMRADLEELQVQMALLKAEASDRAAVIREEALDRAVLFREDALERAADLREDALERAAALREEALERTAALREDALERTAALREDALERTAALREEALERTSALREEAAGKAAALREEMLERTAARRGETMEQAAALREDTAGKAAALRGETMEQAGQFLGGRDDRSAQIENLSRQLESLREKRRSLSRHMTFYRKGLLRGNPSARSRRFGEALRELRKELGEE